MSTFEAEHVADPAGVAPRADRGRQLRATWARRLFDVVASITLLVALLPIMIVIAVAVRLDSPGAVIFRQRRLGRDMRPFTLKKFRTMRPDADPAPHRQYVRELIDGTPERSNGGLYKLGLDDRVTRVGGVLRRWSLDELPQLWNVLRGEMSLVGPRPVIPYETEHYKAWYRSRFAVKPGLTGLWQVSGRSERTYEEMVRLDVDYVERQSLRLDLVILIKTTWVVLSRRGVA